jgi:hypothetical protein
LAVATVRADFALPRGPVTHAPAGAAAAIRHITTAGTSKTRRAKCRLGPIVALRCDSMVTHRRE